MGLVFVLIGVVALSMAVIITLAKQNVGVREQGWRRHAVFTAGFAIYLVLVMVFAIPIVMGECLPRDLPETDLCDAAKATEIRAYGLTTLAVSVLAIGLHFARNRFAPVMLGLGALLPLCTAIVLSRLLHG